MQAAQAGTPVIGEGHFRTIFNHTRDAILLLDVSADRIVEANPRAAALLGYDLAELRGTPVSAIHPEEMARLADFATTVVETGTGWTDELTCTTKLCEAIPTEISASAVDVEGSRLILAVVRDISARRHADGVRRQRLERERQARLQAERQQSLNERVQESRGRLIRGFTHDVKNPLGIADVRLQLLRDGIRGAVSDEQREEVEKVRRSIRRALDLIDDLIEVARAELGEIDIAYGPLRLEPLLDELVEAYRGPARARGHQLVYQPSGELPLVESDSRRLHQILGNLLSNAVKYTPASGRIDVVAECCDHPGSEPGEWVCITVRDTGPGIPAEQQEMLFREFSRLDPDAADGAGLGLAISHRVANALGGDLTVRSGPGDGSAFTIWIPTCLHRADPAAPCGPGTLDA